MSLRLDGFLATSDADLEASLQVNFFAALRATRAAVAAMLPRQAPRLASPRTANVTGSNYVIDGGLVKTL